jgi:hypothetical protein
MPSFSNLNDRRGGKSRTVSSIQTIHWMRPHDAPSFPVLCRLLALLLALAVAPTVAFAQERDHDRDRDHGRGADSIVGSWIVQGFPNPPGPPPFKNLGTFTEDGGNINSDPSSGGGHGLWKKVAPRTFAIKFLTIVPPGFESIGYPPETIITVTSDALILNPQGDELRGAFNTVFTPPTGQPSSFDGTVVLTRIKF